MFQVFQEGENHFFAALEGGSGKGGGGKAPDRHPGPPNSHWVTLVTFCPLWCWVLGFRASPSEHRRTLWYGAPLHKVVGVAYHDVMFVALRLIALPEIHHPWPVWPASTQTALFRVLRCAGLNSTPCRLSISFFGKRHMRIHDTLFRATLATSSIALAWEACQARPDTGCLRQPTTSPCRDGGFDAVARHRQSKVRVYKDGKVAPREASVDAGGQAEGDKVRGKVETRPE